MTEEKKINIALLLEGCPEGMQLDCLIYDDVTLVRVAPNHDGYPIRIRTKSGFETSLTKYGRNLDIKEAKCIIYPKGKTSWEGFVTPVEFKDGDIIISNKGDIHLLRTKDSSYCAYRARWKGLPKFDSEITTDIKVLRLATEEEREKLFKAIEDNGYKWNPETKVLEKLVKPKFKVRDRIQYNGSSNYKPIYIIKSIEADRYIFTNGSYIKFGDEDKYILLKFDINTLKPFSQVLVRDSIIEKWHIQFFDRFDGTRSFPFFCVGSVYNQCIPYKGNEHLRGTADDCDEFYKIWEE